MDKVIRLLLVILASIGLFLGVLALLSPIPVGIFIIGANGAILLCVSPRAQRLLQKCRGKSVRLNRYIHNIELKLERRFKALWRALTATRPLTPTEHDNKIDKHSQP
ncbi:MAG TPA: hypothetical protein VIC26_05315 [Marinagarivorans sp.]